MKKAIYIVGLLSIFSLSKVNSLIGQVPNDLRKKLHHAPNDTIKLDAISRLAAYYGGRNYDSVQYYTDMGLALASSLHYEKAKMVMWSYKGIWHWNAAQYDSALHYFRICEKIAKALNDELRLSAFLNNIGLVYNYQAQYDSALAILFRTRAIRERINDPALSSTINNIGIVYDRMGLDDQALKYYLAGTALKLKNGAGRSLSNSYNNLGIIYKRKKIYDSATFYYRKSLEIAEQYQDISKQANAHNNLAILYQKMDSTVHMAGNHFEKTIALKKKIGDNVGLYNSYDNYANYLHLSNRNKEALEAIASADTIGLAIGKNLHSYKNLQTKSAVLAALHRYEEALVYQKAAMDMRYKETNEVFNGKISEMEVKYDTEKKESEIEKLSIASELQKANLKKARLFQLLIGVILVAFIVSLVIYFNQRSKRQKAENREQELQLEALRGRFVELHTSPAELSVSLNYRDLNTKFHTPLTEREFDALRLSLEGKTNVEIGEALFISVSTVKFHLRNTYSKMGVRNRKEAFRQILHSN